MIRQLLFGGVLIVVLYGIDRNFVSAEDDENLDLYPDGKRIRIHNLFLRCTFRLICNFHLLKCPLNFLALD